MLIKVDRTSWVGGRLDPFAFTPIPLDAEHTVVPFSLDHVIGVFEAALKSYHQRSRATGFWSRLMQAWRNERRVSLKGQYLRAAFFFTARHLEEPLQTWIFYTISVDDCAALLQDMRARANVMSAGPEPGRAVRAGRVAG